MIFFLLFIIGTFFGSFSSVLIERWKHAKSGIVTGRSECPHCGHVLSPLELIPIFSYIFQKGVCRSCHAKISLLYPFVEILFGVVFLLVGFFILENGADLFSLQTLILYTLVFITLVYSVYDFRYMEIPDQIIIPGIYIYGGLLVVGFFIPDIGALFFDSTTYTDMRDLLFDHCIAAIGMYTFFYMQIFIPGGLFLLKKKRYHDFLGLLVSYFTFPFTLLLELIQRKNTEDTSDDIPTWVGGGDLRVALFIGITLGSIHSIANLFIAYITGSIIGIFFLLAQKGKKKKNTQIPFGPFLGFGWLISILFHPQILNFWLTIGGQ